MQSLYKFVKALGLFTGFFTLLKITLGFTQKLIVPGLKYPVFLRKGTIDAYTFQEILIDLEYDIDFSSNNVKVIVDGGANIGLTSVYFANKYPDAKIISIEPEEENFQVLVKNTEAYSQITPLKKGIWGSEGFIEVKDKGYGLRGFMVEEIEAPTATSIPTVSINSLLKSYHLDQIDILKLDIEGSEKKVFEKDYEEWLPKVRCLIVELHDRMVEGTSKSLFKAISKYNFSCEIKGFNLVFVNEDPV